MQGLYLPDVYPGVDGVNDSILLSEAITEKQLTGLCITSIELPELQLTQHFLLLTV